MPTGGSATWSSNVWPETVMMPPTGTTVKISSAGTSDRYGASLKTALSARSGSRSSLKNSFVPSASVCSRPHGPARFGPIRLCMSEISFRSNQIISMTETSSTTNATNTLMTSTTQTNQPTPLS